MGLKEVLEKREKRRNAPLTHRFPTPIDILNAQRDKEMYGTGITASIRRTFNFPKKPPQKS